MSESNTVIRSMHDLGLAAWFGGSLAGAVSVNSLAGGVDAILRDSTVTAPSPRASSSQVRSSGVWGSRDRFTT